MDDDTIMHRSPSCATISSISSSTSSSSPDLIVDFPQVRKVVPHKPLRVLFANQIRTGFVERLSPDLWYSRKDIQAFKFQTALILKVTNEQNMTIAQLAEMSIPTGFTSILLDLEKLFSEGRLSTKACISRSK